MLSGTVIGHIEISFSWSDYSMTQRHCITVGLIQTGRSHNKQSCPWQHNQPNTSVRFETTLVRSPVLDCAASDCWFTDVVILSNNQARPSLYIFEPGSGLLSRIALLGLLSRVALLGLLSRIALLGLLSRVALAIV